MVVIFSESACSVLIIRAEVLLKPNGESHIRLYLSRNSFLTSLKMISGFVKSETSFEVFCSKTRKPVPEYSGYKSISPSLNASNMSFVPPKPNSSLVYRLVLFSINCAKICASKKLSVKALDPMMMSGFEE